MIKLEISWIPCAFLIPSIFLFLWFLNRCWEERWQKACWMIRVFIDFFWKYFCQKQANTALIALLAMVVLAPPGFLDFKCGALTSSLTFCQSLWCLTCVNGQSTTLCVFFSLWLFLEEMSSLWPSCPQTLQTENNWILRKDLKTAWNHSIQLEVWNLTACHYVE